MKKIAYLFFAALIAVAWFSTTDEVTTEEQSLTIGTELEYPPFCYLDGNKIVGFDIDVVKEACKRIGKAYTIKPIPDFDALIPELITGRVDIVAAGLSESPERAKRVLFVESHLDSSSYVALSSSDQGSLKNLDDLKGKTVIVNHGYTTESLVAGIEGVDVLSLNTPADAFLALRMGRGDVFLLASTAAQPILESGQADALHVAHLDIKGDNCAFAIHKDNTDLHLQLSTAIHEMKEDGTLQALQSKWGLL